MTVGAIAIRAGIAPLSAANAPLGSTGLRTRVRGILLLSFLGAGAAGPAINIGIILLSTFLGAGASGAGAAGPAINIGIILLSAFLGAGASSVGRSLAAGSLLRLMPPKSFLFSEKQSSDKVFAEKQLLE